MKLRNILYGLAMIVFLTTQLSAQNTNPVVSNVTFSITGTTVTVHYDVTDVQQGTVTISMEVSSDGGTTWDFAFGTATGDIGAGISIGAVKTINWTYEGVYNANFQIRIIANDLVIDGGTCADPTITYSGKTYNTVQIGTQCWLKENLDVGVYVASTSSGSSHSNVTNNGIIEKYCYGNNTANCATYGGLYDWNEAMAYSTTPGTKGICPTGWHIPTSAEFETLKAAVGSDGNALKAIGQGTGAGAGTNTSGFSTLLAGIRDSRGGFYYLRSNAIFWSSTEYDATIAYSMYLWIDNSNLQMSMYDMVLGFSIRCLKD